MAETKHDASETGIVKTEIDMALKHLGGQAFANERVTHALNESKRIIDKQQRESQTMKGFLKTIIDAHDNGAALVLNDSIEEIRLLIQNK